MPNYSGIWTEQAVMQANGAGNWPNAPGAPTIGTATSLGATSVSVAFTAPTYLGLPATITGYTVTSSPGGVTATGSSSPITVTGLTEGTPYTFTVTATNASGTSPASAASNSVTPVAINYIEEVFSTYLYTGTGSAQTITNGIDLSTKGGLVWTKARSNSANHNLVDTARGGNFYLISNSTAQSNSFTGGGDTAYSFNTNGFTTSNFGSVAQSAYTFVSWTFRKQPKFFDIVTYTGNDTIRTISHNLGSVPACIIIKELDNADLDWAIYHRSLGNTKFLLFTSDVAATSSAYWNNTDPSSTQFTVGTNSRVNLGGSRYVAYLFAHDAGGFGLTGSDNVVSCGSVTANGSGAATINLGYEPQWIMLKNTTSADSWLVFDNMRGLPASGPILGTVLRPNIANSEVSSGNSPRTNATGVSWTAGDTVLTASNTYIYIAIRRGPMKVPTLGTTVYSNALQNGSGTVTTNFPADLVMASYTTLTGSYNLEDRMRGAFQQLLTSSTSSESNDSPVGYNLTLSNVSFLDNYNNASYPVVYESFRRAPSFFDIVCYKGNDTNRTLSHNLTVAPEMMIVKSREYYVNWAIYHSAMGPTKSLYFTSGAQQSYGGFFWNDTAPTSSVFSIGVDIPVNGNNTGYVAYLFATCPGVSKVGSYTGTGALQTVDCGFATGARFVLIKRSDSSGDWFAYDSARGISSGNDPYLLLNSTAEQVTGTNYVDTTSVGFQVTAAAPAGLNASGGTYIFLAIA